MVLSENEYVITRLLWSEGRPLSRAEVQKGVAGPRWNPASVRLILSGMLSKGDIQIMESVKYGQAYEAVLTEEVHVAETLRCPAARMRTSFGSTFWGWLAAVTSSRRNWR